MTELESVLAQITPKQFVRWARAENNKLLHRLGERPVAENMAPDGSTMWMNVTRLLGMTAVGYAIGTPGDSRRIGHQYLVLKVEPEFTGLYNPAAGVVSERTAGLADANFRFSPNLMRQIGSAAPKRFLQECGYELHTNARPVQVGMEFSLDCAPLALYVALLACAQKPEYSQRLKIEAIRDILKQTRG
jgi:hypothetical protein